MKHSFLFRAAAVSAVSIALLSGSVTPGSINATRYQQDVKTLAEDKMKGRGTGTPELKKAAKFIAGEFKKMGLQPGDGKSYYQYFKVTTSAKLGKGNKLDWKSNGASHEVPLPKEWAPYNFSGNGKVEAGAVFAGYGITAPEYNYDDYAGLDVKDKIVIVLRHEPQEFDEKSSFAGKVYTRHAQTQLKATNAGFRGAKALIVVNDVSNHTDPDEVEKFSQRVGPGLASIPVIQVKASLVDEWLKSSGIQLKEWIAEVDKDLKPRGKALPNGFTLALDVQVERKSAEVPNVVAYKPGETDEYVIVGAHFDHLGMGEQSSMAPDLAGKAIHHGADDNASGTAGLIEVARWASTQPKFKRGILFLAFSGEELGLLGSAHYVGEPTLPLAKAVAMINMDMIGRIQNNKVFIGGIGTGSTLKPLMEELRGKTKLTLDFSDQGGYGSSDHFSFTTKQIPVLFFFSGLHADYHKPSDTYDKINTTQAVELLTLVADATERLAQEPNRPQFVRVAQPLQEATASASANRGYGPYFGSVPDMSESSGGFKISDVRDGSPAQKAGLKGGDMILEFDGKAIKSLYDFTYALQAKKPGDEVTIKYRRDGKDFNTTATLTTRPGR